MNSSHWPKFSNFKTQWCNFDVYQNESTLNSHFSPHPQQRRGKCIWVPRDWSPLGFLSKSWVCHRQRALFKACHSEAFLWLKYWFSSICFLTEQHLLTSSLLSVLASFTLIPPLPLPLAKINIALPSPQWHHPTLNHPPQCDQPCQWQ